MKHIFTSLTTFQYLKINHSFSCVVLLLIDDILVIHIVSDGFSRMWVLHARIFPINLVARKLSCIAVLLFGGGGNEIVNRLI
jgi:hypothetical protein